MFNYVNNVIGFEFIIVFGFFIYNMFIIIKEDNRRCCVIVFYIRDYIRVIIFIYISNIRISSF